MGSIPIARSNLSSNLEQARAATESGLSAVCPRNVFGDRSRHDCRETDSQNLDVPETSQGQGRELAQDLAGQSSCGPPLYCLCASPAEPIKRQQYRPAGTKHITLLQAANIIDAVGYASEIGLPLVAHLTIHWFGTDTGNDPDGKLFERVREGLNKWLLRRNLCLTGVWSRDRRAGGQAEVVHCHMLFCLPVEYRSGARLLQVEAAINRLVKRHGVNIWGDFAVDLKVYGVPERPLIPDGLYLIKGGNRDVWKRFRIRRRWRQSQGIIDGKRCGTTQNLGPAARRHAAAKREKA